MGDEDHDARTIHCGNLAQEKITEELLYELFLQAGPLERVSIPKDNGKNRSYGFVTYKYQVSVPYALSVFSGTKLFNRELRLNNRHVNRTNDNNNPTTNVNYNQNRGQAPMEPRPLLPNAQLPHQFQMQNPFSNAALRGSNSFGPTNSMNNLMPPPMAMPRLEFPANQPFDFQSLLALGNQMQLLGNSGLDMNTMGSNDGGGHRHQSKIMHRHENRSHNQNANYSRDKERRGNDRRNRSRSRSRERQNSDWMRHRGRDNRNNDRHDRDNRGSKRSRWS